VDPIPAGAHAAALVIMETTVHGIDLARATGQDDTIDPALAENVLTTLTGMPLDAIRAASQFGPEQPVPAGLRLAGFT
jgi:hypothetical protein